MQLKRLRFGLWQFAVLVTGMTWLLAPALNNLLSDRVTLISEYEVPGQPYSWLFRAGDIAAAMLVISLALWFRRRRVNWLVVALLLIIGIGSMLDPLLSTNCAVIKMVCHEQPNSGFIWHATETVITSAALLSIIFYDAVRRRRLVSIGFAAAQIMYGILYVTHIAKKGNFDTLTQYVYQAGLILWLAWFGRDYITHRPASHRYGQWIRSLFAVWVFGNGLLAIAASFRHLYLHTVGSDLYLGAQTAWLAQHGVITGVILLYVARHIYRGELRARQLTLVLLALEVIKYALITPHITLLASYFIAFSALFASPQAFQRGAVPITVSVRLKDAVYIAGALAVAAITALVTLQHIQQLHTASVAASHLVDRHFDKIPHAERLEAVLLVHTATAFIVVSAVTFLWAIFRPARPSTTSADTAELTALLARHSSSSEDFFKVWPGDKQYFWNDQHSGFIAYKVTGAVAFALDGPICPAKQQTALIAAFVAWARLHRLTACFLLIAEDRLPLYNELRALQIGASARIDSELFTSQTCRSKWWRWKLNRAAKQGYVYQCSQPPHDHGLLQSCNKVSSAWLQHGGHQEQGFALGYYDTDYLQRCQLHYLTDASGRVVAFANQLPQYRQLPMATVDLIRFDPSANDAMPFLLARSIETIHSAGQPVFDLGFVPFAKATAPLLRIAKALTASRFSARGLEQFKSKFEPEWCQEYLAYDGDLADLAAIALNLEKAMER